MIDTISYKLKFIPLYDKESVEGITLDICRAKDCLIDKTGVVVLSSRSNINQGDKEKSINEKEAKPYYKDFFAELRNRVDPKSKKVMMINILDEAGIAPETCGMSWHKAKKTLNIKDPSFMGAFNNYINSLSTEKNNQLITVYSNDNITNEKALDLIVAAIKKSGFKNVNLEKEVDFEKLYQSRKV